MCLFLRLGVDHFLSFHSHALLLLNSSPVHVSGAREERRVAVSIHEKSFDKTTNTSPRRFYFSGQSLCHSTTYSSPGSDRPFLVVVSKHIRWGSVRVPSGNNGFSHFICGRPRSAGLHFHVCGHTARVHALKVSLVTLISRQIFKKCPGYGASVPDGSSRFEP